MWLLFFFLPLQNKASSGLPRGMQQKGPWASHVYVLQLPFSDQTYSISYGWKTGIPDVSEKSG